MTIGQVAESSQVPITTLRFYEKRGLIDAPERVGGKRQYEADVLVRLMLIRYCRSAGLTLEEIARVVADCSPDYAVRRSLAEERIEAIDEQIEQLRVAREMMLAATECRCEDIELCACGALDSALGKVSKLAG